METFVIRIWVPGDADATAKDIELRGLAEHVRDGDRTAFRGTRELVAFIESSLESSRRSGKRESPR